MSTELRPPEKVYNIEGMGGSTKLLRQYAELDSQVWSAFNPSIAYSEEDGYICVFRASNYFYTDQGIIRVVSGEEIYNRTYVGQFDENMELVNVRQVKYVGEPRQPRGPEDAKLYRRNGQWYFHAIIQEREHTPVQRVATFEFDFNKAEARMIQKYESYEFHVIEKNWAVPLYEDSPHFDFVYSSTGTFKDGVISLQTGRMNKGFSRLRGGSNLWTLDDGTYLGISHTQYRKQLKNIYIEELQKHMDSFLRSYTHRFVRYDQRGSIIEMSQEFVMDDFQLEFASGIHEYKDDFMISYGVNDAEAHLAFIPKETVLGMLEPVDEEGWNE